MAMPTPPDWLMTLTLPCAIRSGRKVQLKEQAVLIRPNVFGPSSTISCSRQNAAISSSNAAPTASVSLKPALITIT